MKRRDILKVTVAASGMTTLAGCISSGDEEGGATADTTDISQEENNTPTSNTENTETVSEDERDRRQAVEDYRAAYEGMQESKQTIKDMRTEYDSENYSDVISTLEGIESTVQEYNVKFSEAVQFIDQEEYDEYHSSVLSASQECLSLRFAGENLRRAAQEAAAGNTSEAERLRGIVDDDISDAEQHHEDVLTPSEAEERLT